MGSWKTTVSGRCMSERSKAVEQERGCTQMTMGKACWDDDDMVASVGQDDDCGGRETERKMFKSYTSGTVATRMKVFDCCKFC